MIDTMQQYWFGDIRKNESGAELIPAPGDDADLVARIRYVQEKKATSVPLTSRDMQLVYKHQDRSDYLSRLRRVSILLAREMVEEKYKTGDQELIHLVTIIDELDRMAGSLGDHVVQWHDIRTLTFERKQQSRSMKGIMEDLSAGNDPVIAPVAEEMVHLYEIRRLLSCQVQEIAGDLMPNTSALLGPLVASRLMTAAGGLSRLAELPASTVQVMGARSALFSHLVAGTPPPKHGILYQHSRVHRAPAQRRGRVSRALAAVVVIAARIDWYRKEKDPVFLARAEAKIKKAGLR
ncbi:MAG: RNA-processing protein [Methanospirillaceae archaeon]|nr:RNA-processing protein [Methanospirillaceae archaeon]